MLSRIDILGSNLLYPMYDPDYGGTMDERVDGAKEIRVSASESEPQLNVESTYPLDSDYAVKWKFGFPEVVPCPDFWL